MQGKTNDATVDYLGVIKKESKTSFKLEWQNLHWNCLYLYAHSKWRRIHKLWSWVWSIELVGKKNARIKALILDFSSGMDFPIVLASLTPKKYRAGNTEQAEGLFGHLKKQDHSAFVSHLFIFVRPVSARFFKWRDSLWNFIFYISMMVLKIAAYYWALC